VTESLGIRLRVTPGFAEAARFAGAVELGLRRNPKRAQLLVSRVLGKHVPVPVGEVLAAGAQLGASVRAACAGLTPIVIGFAETATALGHQVASVCGPEGTQAPYLHTTRRPWPAGAQVLRFSEEHSHAVDQSLAVLHDADAGPGRPLVLVDDELTTGKTAVNAILALHERWPRETYVLASLIDCRAEDRRAEVAAAVRAIGARVLSVSLLHGSVELPGDVLARAGELIESLPAPGPGRRRAGAAVTRIDVALPPGLTATAARRWRQDQQGAARAVMAQAAASLPVSGDRRTLVLGDEELMYLPQLLAAALGPDVHTSTITRTPAVACDVPGYPLRTVLSFASTEDGRRPVHAYNVGASTAAQPGNAPGFDHVVLVTDAPDDSLLAPVVAELSLAAASSVHVVTVRPDAAH
jgi:adenine/guanine phosphoribosyltransferase-like PRPP-binding protein